MKPTIPVFGHYGERETPLRRVEGGLCKVTRLPTHGAVRLGSSHTHNSGLGLVLIRGNEMP